MNQVAERYASAFFSLAKDEGMVAQLKGEATVLRRVCSRDLIRLLDNRSVTKDQKKELFAQCLPGANRYLMNFLCLLVDKGRCRALPEILDCFIAFCNDELGIQVATVWSARPLGQAELDTIESAISARYGKQVEIVNKIDESLLAGTRIYINDRVYDSSLKAKVKAMRDELLKEAW